MEEGTDGTGVRVLAGTDTTGVVAGTVGTMVVAGTAGVVMATLVGVGVGMSNGQ